MMNVPEGARDGIGEFIVVSVAGDCGDVELSDVHPPDNITTMKIAAERMNQRICII
jgi:hypothetical protein